VAAVTMAENAASEERSFAFMFLEIGLIENENGRPVNLVMPHMKTHGGLFCE
jgi:hypothetical protein